MEIQASSRLNRAEVFFLLRQQSLRVKHYILKMDNKGLATRETTKSKWNSGIGYGDTPVNRKFEVRAIYKQRVISLAALSKTMHLADSLLTYQGKITVI